MPLISIIIPIYNSEKYLNKSITCCINQTLKDIEIVFVDDKGQDDSVKIIQEYMQKDSRIKLIDNITNQGIFRAKRTGALNANGKYLMFLDPDDELELNACEILYNEIERYSVDFIYFNGHVIDNGCVKNISKSLPDFKLYKIEKFQKFFIKNKLKWVLWLKIYNKEIYLKALSLIDSIDNSFKTNLTEDVSVFYHVINVSKKVAILNHSFYKYNIYETSVSNNLSNVNFQNCLQDYKKAIDLIGSSCIKNNFSKKFTKQYLTRLNLDKISMEINYHKKNYGYKNIFNLIRLKLIKKQQKIKNIFIKF
ncbi:glycosyltransferase family 2 protein [Campylobacter sp. Cr9]|uniref:glycosyltransferase family 2 protein n=1 Tax=Campylobacter sp. Cr9 TaxID=2735728 RepID=UPI00301514E6|nr:glycosyltransferase family 2 protein [Campylobacter sp. Cr9]